MRTEASATNLIRGIPLRQPTVGHHRNGWAFTAAAVNAKFSSAQKSPDACTATPPLSGGRGHDCLRFVLVEPCTSDNCKGNLSRVPDHRQQEVASA